MARNIDNSNFDEALKQGEDYVKDAADNTQKQFKQGEEKIRHVIGDVEKRLKENPWPVVAGVAATCVLVGFIMGSRRGN